MTIHDYKTPKNHAYFTDLSKVAKRSLLQIKVVRRIMGTSQNWKCEFQCMPDTFALNPLSLRIPNLTLHWTHLHGSYMSKDHITSNLCTLTVWHSSHTRPNVNSNECTHLGTEREVFLLSVSWQVNKLFLFYRCSKCKRQVCSIGMALSWI